MKYPCLVPKRLCKTDISIFFEHDRVNEDGEPMKAGCYEGKCNYQDKARSVLTDDRKVIEITGTALFPGDICPELSVLAGGKATVFGVKRRIIKGTKARNPDGTVNYTEVLLK